jgi:Fusaric acid resistance protein-like
VLFALASRTFRRLTGEEWVFDPVGAGVRVPVIIGALASGLVAGRPVAGVLAASGAYFVGFGAPLNLFGSHPLLLAAVSVVIGAAAIVGSLAGAHALLAVVVVAGLGALCGAAAAREAGPAWIALQCALAGVIGTSYPASLQGAAERALLIVAGVFAQAAFLSVIHFTWRRAPPPPPPEPEAPRYALQLALGLAAAMALERALDLANGYWVPLTTLLVLRPGTRHTMARALARTAGTLAGVGTASAILVAIHPAPGALIALVAIAALGAYVFHKATYGLFSACVTTYVVFLLSFAGQRAREIELARIVATLLGAAIGLAVQWADDVRGGGWRRG